MKSIYSLRFCIVHYTDDRRIENVLIVGGFKNFNDACIYLEANFRKVIWWLINIEIKQRPYNEISPRQDAEYHTFRISLIFIAASCGELNPGEIKNDGWVDLP